MSDFREPLSEARLGVYMRSKVPELADAAFRLQHAWADKKKLIGKLEEAIQMAKKRPMSQSEAEIVQGWENTLLEV